MPMPPIDITLTIPEAAQDRVLAALNQVFPADEDSPGETDRARLKRWFRNQLLRMVQKHEAGKARLPKDESLID